MRLVFMGTGGFALPSLDALLDSSHEILALFTQPDKPAGRGHKLRMPETKSLALERGVAVHQPPRVRGEETVALLADLRPDCIVVVAYGQIIPKSILEIPPRGIINVHGSLLPRYRGAAPVQWAIARGETETGVTTMLMDAGLDTGPILAQRAHPIANDDTGGSLEAKLARLGADLLSDTLVRWESGALVPTPQDDSQASLAPRIKKEEGLVDWNLPARAIDCRVRAFNPWPVSYVVRQGAPLRIWKAHPVEPTGLGDADVEPGRIVRVDGGSVLVACSGATRLSIDEVQPAGGRRMAAADFARGQRLSAGESLEA